MRVVSFESRRASEMSDLITRNGGQAVVAPSMREIPLEQNTEAMAFGERLMKGEIHALILLTGVGVKTLFDVLETRHSHQSLLKALSKVTLVARGPKPVTVLSEWGLKPTLTIPEPNTRHEILAALDLTFPLKGKTVAVQEYGIPDKDLNEGLLKRGAKLVRVPVYRWALPEDTAPLRKALRTIVEGQADVVLFTNGTQINHVMQMAQEEGVEEELRKALAKVVVASVGPTCSQFMDEYGVPVDVEPEHPKMGNLVLEASRKGPGLLEKKRTTVSSPKVSIGDPRNMSHGSPITQFGDDVLKNSPFLKACRREPTEVTPVWLMRQAGRYMKEYRDIRDRHSFLDLCKDSDLAAEVTIYAVNRLGVDAAIIFSDLLVIVEPMGLNLEYAKGEGPVIHNPVRTASDVTRLKPLQDPSALSYVYDAIRKTRAGLPPTIPLIGFAGAPFTLASYMVEGMGSRNFIHTKSLMYKEPKAWHALMETLTASLIPYLNAQIAAGAQAVQLFDSWVGCLSPEDYRQYVLPHSRTVLRGLTKGTPVIHFGTGTSALLELMKEAGGDVIGLDWRVSLAEGWKRVGYDRAIMGNMDPTTLFAEIPEIRKQAQTILDQAGERPGHIFNLGHGVLPQTPVGHVKALVDVVHELSRKK